MKSFRTYISKNLASFTGFILFILFANTIIFAITFYKTITEEYGDASPHVMLEMVSSSSTTEQINTETAETLRQNNIWAIYLNPAGECFWTFNLPEEVPLKYSLQDVSLFSKGYIKDYPVFIWNTDDGLLVLGYPKESYVKLTSNYYPVQAIKRLPLCIIGMFVLDILFLFSAYYFSKRKIIQNTEPIVSAVKTLADGKPVSLCVEGELYQIASSVNKASEILSRQNESRANWISGVSHDIRTPLSMIMGYADQIFHDEAADKNVKEQAEIIKNQSVKIKDLVQDLNLVSKLEYETQPFKKEPVRISKLVRSYAADLLNSGIADTYTLDIEIASDTETELLECNARLISRAVNNLVQNSIKHNPQGCDILIALEKNETSLVLSVTDNGTGISSEKIQELKEKPHYMESMDESLNLRHGLGLLIVQQIMNTHNGNFKIENIMPHGCKMTLTFPVK